MAALARNIPRLIDASKSNATLRKYKSYFSKFESWCSINKLSSLPATPATVSLFISHLVQCKSSSSVLSSVFYAVQWYHDKNLFPNPCSDKLVKLTFEGALRTLSKTSINKKQPITSNIISKVFSAKNNVADLSHLRTRLLFVLGFAGFFRAGELCNTRRSDITFCDTHMEIKIRCSKTDVYRRGNIVYIAKTNSNLCPVQCLQDYLSLAGMQLNSDLFIFRSLRYFKKSNTHKLARSNKSLSYTCIRELILNALKEVGEDPSKFGLHSLRSGGATAAANLDIPDRLFKAHGRWRSETAKDGYIQDNIEKVLPVSKNLGL